MKIEYICGCSETIRENLRGVMLGLPFVLRR